MIHPSSTPHASEDSMESYALQQMTEEEMAVFEEHLMVCHECQDRMQETDRYIKAMKCATRELREEQASYFHRLLGSIRAVPARPVLGFGLAAALAAFFIVSVPQKPVQPVELAALRAAEAGAHVRSSVIPELRLAADGLTASSPYTIEVVSEQGTRIWAGSAPVKDNRLAVRLRSELSAGHYWVRVYADASRGRLLHEYGLTVDR